MDYENSIVEEQPKSLFQVDQTFLQKILARKSFKGQSMRMFDTENVVSVPFDWEMRPGTPKHPQTEIVPPSIKPSPAVQSQTLGKPTFASTHKTIVSCFWNKSRKNHRQGKKMGNAKGRRGPFHGNNIVTKGNGKGNNTPESVEFSDVNGDSMSSSDHSRSCSSSSSSSSVSTSSSSHSNSGSSNSSGLRSFAKGLIKWSF